MLSFPSQNYKKYFFSDRPGVLKKTDPGDSKPTCFQVWPDLKNVAFDFVLLALKLYPI